MKKKLTIFALILVLVASFCVVLTACGEEQEVFYDHFSFVYDSGAGGLVLSVNKEKTLPADLTVPSEYYADSDSGRTQKRAVVAIADDAFKNLSAVVSIVVPSSVKKIGNNAFSGCTGLTSIELTGVETLGKSAFRNCTGLTSVTLSDKLAEVSDGAFYGCSNLLTVASGKIKTIGAEAFSGCIALMSLDTDYSQLRTIGARAFFFTGCFSEIDITSCTSVGAYAFQGWAQSQTVKYSSTTGWDANWNADASFKKA